MSDLYVMYKGKPIRNDKGDIVRDEKGQPVLDTAAFADRYDGIDYVFEVGETVKVPPMAAQHIFGYGETDKTRALRRQGVLNHSSGAKQAMEWLGQFVFENVEPAPPPNLRAKTLMEAQYPNEAMVEKAPSPSRRRELPTGGAQ